MLLYLDRHGRPKLYDDSHGNLKSILAWVSKRTGEGPLSWSPSLAMPDETVMRGEGHFGAGQLVEFLRPLEANHDSLTADPVFVASAGYLLIVLLVRVVK